MESLYKIVLTFTFVTLFQLLMASKNCSEKCGNMNISYPFGIKNGCFRDGFRIFCNEGKATTIDGIEIINITISQAQMRIYNWIGFSCNYPNGGGNNVSYNSSLCISDRRYRVSHTLNKFTAVGCQTLATMVDPYPRSYHYTNITDIVATGCISLCTNQSSFVNNSTCSGVGCCEAAISPGRSCYRIKFDSAYFSKAIWDYSPCTYAFVAEEGVYSFNQSDIEKGKLLRRFKQAPIVIDWVLGNENCKEAKLNKSGTYACVSLNSTCKDSQNGPGYICSCSRGYEGNPYLDNGCTGIDMCKTQPCYGDCTNTPGSYQCLCPRGTRGNASIEGGCIARSSPMVIIITVGFSTFLFSAVLYTTHQKVKQIRAKEKCFRQNGGLLLQSQINAHQSVRFKIYSIEEIRKATNNFDENSIAGRGGQGIVFKGITYNNTKVAIKKSIVINAKRMKVFAKEMYVLSLINHKNVIQILGCCLEVEVPILVYEYIPRGTLYQRIQSKDQNMSLSFRLKVAIETASALAYLHNDSHPSIIHGDIKSSNILLDENDVAKVSDFGASMYPLKEVNDTGVPGTYGYLDPESLVTGQLTVKSDVFSFGVVVLELLTRMKAVYFEKSREKRNLSLKYKEEGLERLLDDEIKHTMPKEQITELSELLTACLKTYGDERPSMTKVVAWLHKVREYDQNLISENKIDPIILSVHEEGSNSSANMPEYNSSSDQAALTLDYRLTR